VNWGAAVLILAGIGVVAIGVTGSQKTVCQAITGSDCTWMPDFSSGNSSNSSPSVPENQVAKNIATVIGNCKNDSTCTGYATLAYHDATQDSLLSGDSSGEWTSDFVKQIAAESGFNPKAVSPSGAEGIAQLMPATAKSLGVNPFDVKQSLSAAANLMSGYEQYWTQFLQGSALNMNNSPIEAEALALSSYNFGQAATQDLVLKYGSNWMQHAPQETQNYILGIEYPKSPVSK